MKKFSSKVLAGIFTAALLAGGAFANDYVENPDWSKPETVEVGQKDVQNVEEGKNCYVDLYNGETGVELSEKALQTLKEKKAGITIDFNNGVLVEVTAVDLHDVKNFSFALGISNVTGGSAVTDDKVEVPENSVLIQPVYNGDTFEATVTVRVPEGLDTKKAKLYHCDGKGGVEEVKDALSEGDYYYNSLEFKISHASYYIISDGEVKASADAGQSGETEEPGASGSQASGSGSGEGGKGPNTGVTLPIALVALAGGSVAVSAIVAKKRK